MAVTIPGRPGDGGAYDKKKDGTPEGHLTGDKRNAYDAILLTLQQYGLEGLAPKLLQYVQQGYSSDTIALELQQTNEWKQRFIGNEARKKAGLPVLSPQEYLATERSYRQIMREAGLPGGFYDQNSDFADFIGKDVSPTELSGRVKNAKDFIDRADPKQLAYMRQHYTKGDLIAAALDPTRAADVIQKQFEAATIGGNAAAAGLTVGTGLAERLAATGLDDNTSRAGFSALGRDRATITKLSGIDGTQQLTDEQLAAGAFLNDAAVTDALDRLKQKESARFGGSSAIGQGSLTRNTAGI